MFVDLGADTGYAARLLLAAFLGALVGLERELHDHPAGMRTHLLVSLGSAGFTVLSIAMAQGPGADPTRIAAQIVSGIGFLGAGAILKEGATIRGLTTAASLWSVAAVGMAAGAGAVGRGSDDHGHRDRVVVAAAAGDGAGHRPGSTRGPDATPPRRSRGVRSGRVGHHVKWRDPVAPDDDRQRRVVACRPTSSSVPAISARPRSWPRPSPGSRA